MQDRKALKPKVGDKLKLKRKEGEYEIRAVDDKGVTLAKVGEKNSSLAMVHNVFREKKEEEKHTKLAEEHSIEAEKPANKNIRQWHLNRANEHAKLAKEKRNNMSNEAQNSNIAKPMLAPVNFDAIHEARRNFIYSNNRYPTVIVMHPADGTKFIELMHKEFGYLMHKEFGYCAMPNLMEFQGMQMIRSFDVEEGKWCLY